MGCKSSKHSQPKRSVAFRCPSYSHGAKSWSQRGTVAQQYDSYDFEESTYTELSPNRSGHGYIVDNGGEGTSSFRRAGTGNPLMASHNGTATTLFSEGDEYRFRDREEPESFSQNVGSFDDEAWNEEQTPLYERLSAENPFVPFLSSTGTGNPNPTPQQTASDSLRGERDLSPPTLSLADFCLAPHAFAEVGDKGVMSNQLSKALLRGRESCVRAPLRAPPHCSRCNLCKLCRLHVPICTSTGQVHTDWSLSIDHSEGIQSADESTDAMGKMAECVLDFGLSAMGRFGVLLGAAPTPCLGTSGRRRFISLQALWAVLWRLGLVPDERFIFCILQKLYFAVQFFLWAGIDVDVASLGGADILLCVEERPSGPVLSVRIMFNERLHKGKCCAAEATAASCCSTTNSSSAHHHRGEHHHHQYTAFAAYGSNTCINFPLSHFVRPFAALWDETNLDIGTDHRHQRKEDSFGILPLLLRYTFWAEVGQNILMEEELGESVQAEVASLVTVVIKLYNPLLLVCDA